MNNFQMFHPDMFQTWGTFFSWQKLGICASWFIMKFTGHGGHLQLDSQAVRSSENRRINHRAGCAVEGYGISMAGWWTVEQTVELWIRTDRLHPNISIFYCFVRMQEANSDAEMKRPKTYKNCTSKLKVLGSVDPFNQSFCTVLGFKLHWTQSVGNPRASEAPFLAGFDSNTLAGRHELQVQNRHESYWKHGVILMSFWCHLDVILVSSWCHLGVILVSFWESRGCHASGCCPGDNQTFTLWWPVCWEKVSEKGPLGPQKCDENILYIDLTNSSLQNPTNMKSWMIYIHFLGDQIGWDSSIG